jgi:hypothetical protein
MGRMGSQWQHITGRSSHEVRLLFSLKLMVFAIILTIIGLILERVLLETTLKIKCDE